MEEKFNNLPIFIYTKKHYVFMSSHETCKRKNHTEWQLGQTICCILVPRVCTMRLLHYHLSLQTAALR